MRPASAPLNRTPSPFFQLPEILRRQACPESVTLWRQHITYRRCIAVQLATREHDGSYTAWTGRRRHHLELDRLPGDEN